MIRKVIRFGFVNENSADSRYYLSQIDATDLITNQHLQAIISRSILVYNETTL